MKISKVPLVKFYSLCILFSLTGFVRSIGLLNAAHVCYPLLIESIQIIMKRTKRPFTDFFKIWFRIASASLLFLTPITILILIAKENFCISENLPDLDVAMPSFCKSPIPYYYGYIQAEYWNVEFLYWFKSRQFALLFTILTCGPVTIGFLRDYLTKRDVSFLGSFTGNLVAFLDEESYQSYELVMYPTFVITFLLVVISFLVANVNSSERFFSAVPFYYIMMLQFWERTQKPKFRWRFLEFLRKNYLVGGSIGRQIASIYLFMSDSATL